MVGCATQNDQTVGSKLPPHPIAANEDQSGGYTFKTSEAKLQESKAQLDDLKRNALTTNSVINEAAGAELKKEQAK